MEPRKLVTEINRRKSSLSRSSDQSVSSCSWDKILGAISCQSGIVGIHEAWGRLKITRMMVDTRKVIDEEMRSQILRQKVSSNIILLWLWTVLILWVHKLITLVDGFISDKTFQRFIFICCVFNKRFAHRFSELDVKCFLHLDFVFFFNVAKLSSRWLV